MFRISRESHIETKQILTSVFQQLKDKPNKIFIDGERRSITQNYLMKNIYNDDILDDEGESEQEDDNGNSKHIFSFQNLFYPFFNPDHS